jgi:chemotaxis signal transduction protein
MNLSKNGLSEKRREPAMEANGGEPSDAVGNGPERRLAELRAAFDEAFALPPPPPVQAQTEFALVVAGAGRYAIRMSEMAGLEVDRKIVPMPEGPHGLLGLSAVEGQLIPVFELGALLGGGERGGAPRWIALHRGQELVGLAFDEFQGSRRVASEAVHELEPTTERTLLSHQAIQVDSGLVHVLDLGLVVAGVARGGRQPSGQEKGH